MASQNTHPLPDTLTRGDWGGKIPPPQLWKIAAGGPRGKKKKEGKKGQKRKGERGKKGKEGKRKEKKEGKRRKGREKSKLKVFLEYSFWLGVQAR